ncbi:MAG: hypothetical protein EZS28_023313 [Streblomastix strix]|uniref:Uncharacterized protein n=1 Tax=Streblomastix strix TaxID=222440 RepID=A0A5J4VFD1_9EUKA|nr:MAG: hypothetical protein EZS28_023313 [Streblomastix strix]
MLPGYPMETDLDRVIAEVKTCMRKVGINPEIAAAQCEAHRTPDSISLKDLRESLIGHVLELIQKQTSGAVNRNESSIPSYSTEKNQYASAQNSDTCIYSSSARLFQIINGDASTSDSGLPDRNVAVGELILLDPDTI